MIFLWPVSKLRVDSESTFVSGCFMTEMHLQLNAPKAHLWMVGSRLPPLSVRIVLCLAWRVPLRQTSGACSISGPILSDAYNPSSSVLHASSSQWSRHVPCLSSLHFFWPGKCLGRENRDTTGSLWGPRFCAAVPPCYISRVEFVSIHLSSFLMFAAGGKCSPCYTNINGSLGLI